MKQNNTEVYSCRLLKKIMMSAFLTLAASTLSLTLSLAAHPVTGFVRVGTGDPLIGASVIEKGTSNGAMTNSDGSFALTVSGPGSILSISFIGYAGQDVPVNGAAQLNIVMEEDETGLEEVIVVAYGTQKKSSVTGAIAVVNEAELKTVTSPSVNAMLQGKVAGVQVLNSSGKPGEAAQIRIRGKGTLNSSVDPLWVIDGVVGGLGALLNPNEIASISVLKDAAATALYGSRATNGVILVTTKSGRMGESKVEVSAKLGVAQQHLGNFRLMNSQELYDYTASMSGRASAGISGWFNEDLLKYDTDWFDFATQTALSQDYTVSYSVGNEKYRSFLSANFYNEDGTVKGYEYSHYSLRSNTDYVVNKRLTLKAKLSGSYYHNSDRQHDIAMTNLPWDHPYNEDGSIRTGKEPDWHGRDESNYLYNNQLNWQRAKRLGATANIGFDYNITSFLVFESNNSVSMRAYLEEEYVDPRSIGAESYSGSIRDKNDFHTTRYTNQLLRFNKLFAGVHDVSAFLGYEYSDVRSQSNEAEGRGIPAGGEVINVAANPYAMDGNINESAMQSVYFNANYTYNDRYMAQLSYRTDGSSKFGKNNRYGNFFTVGAAWALHNEGFLKDVDFVNQLKLRASYGSIGNTPGSGDYGYMSVYSLSTMYNGVPTAFPSRLGNPNLTWEKCYETNIAAETRLFDRVSLSLDFYDKNTSDLLYNVQLTSVTGFTNQYQNVGAVSNRGFEVALSPDIIRTKDFLWTADLNLGYNKSKIVKLYNSNQQIDGLKIREEGIPLDTWYLYDWAGVDMYTGAPTWYIHNADGSTAVTTERAKASRVKLGSSNPDFSGGLATTASYRGISLSAAFSFVSGNYIYNYAREFYDNDGAYPQYNSMALKDGWKRWEKPGDVATHPKPIAGGNNDSNKSSSRYLEDGSFIRFNNLTLSYALPASRLKRAGIKSANVSLSGENLFILTKFSGPDAELGAKENTPGTSLYPMPRRFSLGLNLAF
ncbi:MAG: TonB-dependent receptor [Prevotellaceae bacterium]|jgi:TonB-linked SusC/RagA family outer membrane protein|nr:TonB-dependent receptor [Prevotellaceae bacterium]